VVSVQTKPSGGEGKPPERGLFRLLRQFCRVGVTLRNRTMLDVEPRASILRGALCLAFKRSVLTSGLRPYAAKMPVRRIVQASLNRGTRFVAMFGRDPHGSALDRRGQWSRTFSKYTAQSVLPSQSPSSHWPRARPRGRNMIELPHEFLSAIFVIILVADVRRSRNWLSGSADTRDRTRRLSQIGGEVLR
jgi:hypothetical protein